MRVIASYLFRAPETAYRACIGFRHCEERQRRRNTYNDYHRPLAFAITTINGEFNVCALLTMVASFQHAFGYTPNIH